MTELINFRKMPDQNIKKELVLREKLALQRTVLANQTTLLAFIRTSMYFLVAGLSVDNILILNYGFVIVYAFYIISVILLILGFINYFVQKSKIQKSKIHIGNYQSEYDK